MAEIKEYKLLDPITHGAEKVTELVLTRPGAGHMRGFSFKHDLEDLDADKILPVIARICVKPQMTERDLDSLSARDYLEITGDLVAFLSNQSAWTTKDTSTPGLIAQSEPPA